MASLLNDDLFAMIGIGAEVMTEELGRLPEFSDTTASWGKFLEVLAAVRDHGNREQVAQLRGALTEVRSTVAG